VENNRAKIVSIRQNAWHGDGPLELRFPINWSVDVVGDQPISEVGEDAVYQAINQPFGCPALVDLARGRSSAAILVDDLSRPTPASRLLRPVLDALAQAGVAPSRIVIVIAGGTHTIASADDILKKTGSLPEGMRVVAHNCREDIVEIGKTHRGTPIWINREVAQSDVKIALGCIYPHPAAGFSGGSKLLAPGAAGYETIRILHDRRRGSKNRGGSILTEFREEIEEMAACCGLDFILNVTLNQYREPAAVFAGDRNQAFIEGVAHARRVYAVETSSKADIILVDVYPFDADFQFAFDRGLWPMDSAQPGSTCVLLASCPRGLGSHVLYPVSNAFLARISRRLRYLSLSDIMRIGERFSAIRRMLLKRQLQIQVVSANLRAEEVIQALPRAQVVPSWESLIPGLTQKYHNGEVKVALVRCAPLMFPLEKDKNSG
jgi:nickel-dependent lactate racemase